MRAAIYARVSTEEQAERQNSIPMQISECENYIKRMDSWILQGKYVDEGITGAHTNRQELSRLLNDVKSGLIDVIVVWKYDRLSRSLRDTINLNAELSKFNCSTVSITQNIDTTTSAGKLMFNQLASFAEYERELIGERTSAGLKRKAQRGEWASGKVPYGFDLQDGKLIPNKQAETVKTMYRMYSEGKGFEAIARYLNLTRQTPSDKHQGWTAQTVQGILSNPVYIGTLTHGKRKYVYQDSKRVCKHANNYTVKENSHDSIISKELYDEVQRRREAKKAKHGFMPRKTASLLSSILRCSCGSAMYATSSGEYGYYRCRNAQNRRGCERKAIRHEQVDKVFLEQLKIQISDELLQGIRFEDNHQEILQQIKQEEQSLLRSLKEQDNIKENLLSALERNLIDDDDFSERRELNKKNTEAIKEELTKVRNKINHLPTKEQIEDTRELFTQLHDMINKPFEEISQEEIPIIRELILELTDSIVLTEEDKLVVKFVQL